MMHVLIRCLRGQLKCIPAPGLEGQTFNKTSPPVQEWEHILTWTSVFFLFSFLHYYSGKKTEGWYHLWIYWPKVLIPASEVDPLLVQITPAAEKAVQLWDLIRTRICSWSHVHFLSNPLILSIACASLVDTSLLMTEFHGCGYADEHPVRIRYIEEFTYFL